MSSEVTIYTTDRCPYCSNAKALLHARGLGGFREIRVDQSAEQMAEMLARSGRRTVPQIWIGERHVGGYEDLLALARNGGLD